MKTKSSLFIKAAANSISYILLTPPSLKTWKKKSD